jgi:CheY-like chemotaxis protein
MRILLVDDYVPVMTLAAAALDDDSGHELDTATDGREALEKATASRYDLVVMNLRLREIDGPECLSALRKLLPHQKVLVLAEAVDEATGVALRASGIRPDAVVIGPRDRKVLARRIGTMSGKRD